MLQILKMRKYIFVFLCLSTLSLNAQDEINTTSSFLDKTEFKIGYSGNLLWDNGLNFGAEYLWIAKPDLESVAKNCTTRYK